ncbi:MAG TPA: translesion DNA synthesis-associated protein ImuA [Dokdonella sp.]|uniref:translesion DNA synthesis-associated protein ImuA n=1 Tax=Dokdonella sp. TaxID=2291710 RepID=UPI002D7F0355|nr:translesion DNA synthesis-associated protein ImuA [Dokdonella sp.]HET9033668.1 translesion DNA synthesis-associated protein ImuA [Dokdonella sp.]
MSAVALQQVLRDPRIWRGPQTAAVVAEASGHAHLDAFLPGGGWPLGALSEILIEADGLGEMSLLLPVLARLSEGERPIVMVDPPYLPYPVAFAQGKLRSARVQVLKVRGKDAWWAAEQCLASAACAAVLCWPQGIDERGLRRLQLAAESGRCLAFAFRDQRHAAQASPAALRLRVHSGLRVQVLKCRGRTATSALALADVSGL